MKQSPRLLSELGAKAESIAVAHLKKKGYRILEKNLRTRLGEIDVLARQKDVLVLVEVKSGQGDSPFGPPQLRVDARKQRKLRQLATELQKRHRLVSTDIRFDVVSVQFFDGKPVVELIENAF